MYLSKSEVERFYRIWFPLLHYVNQQQKLLPTFPSQWGNADVAPEDAVLLRDALWANDSLREAFIAENPANLSAADLALVDSWKYRVADSFFIFRYLKKYTVFISGGSPARAYGVLGILSSIEEIAGPYLPIYVKAVLLPFEDRIIYDSLLSPYPVYFGGGYRSSLMDTYRSIQEREGIITALPPHVAEGHDQNIRAKNKKLLTAFQKALGQAGLSPKMMTEHTTAIADFADEMTPPRLLLDISRPSLETYLASKSGKVNLVSFKRFVQFLRDTGRMGYEQAEDILDFVKHKQRE